MWCVCSPPPPPLQLAVDKELIDFGTHVVGETISRAITLTNCGALGTRFQLCRSTGGGGGAAAAAAAHPEVAPPPSSERMVGLKMSSATQTENAK